MYVAPGTLDQRIRLYAREDIGADGFQRPVYVFQEERWGRVDVTAQTQTIPLAPQAHVDNRSSVVATLAFDVAADPNGVVRVGEALYFVRGVVRIRQVQATQLALEAIDPTAYAMLEVYEADDVLDGVHLIEPEGTP